MIDLRKHQGPLLRLLETGLRRFQESRPSVPVRHVALYSCPWSGWVSLCVDSAPQLEQNCPDFEYVEIALYEAPDWASEYDSAEAPRVARPDGEVVEVDLETEGDEGFNRVFFEFICDLLTGPEAASVLQSLPGPDVRVGVQMLDSNLSRSWVPDAA